MNTPPRRRSPSTITSPPTAPTRWPLERVLFALAGTVTLVSAGLAAVSSRWFLLLAAFAGINQWLFVLFGACPASLILRRAFSLPSLMYPERAAQSASGCRTSAARSPSPALSPLRDQTPG